MEFRRVLFRSEGLAADGEELVDPEVYRDRRLLRGPVIGRLCVEEERRRAGEGVVQEGLQEGGVDLAAVVVAGEGPDLVGQNAVGPGAVLPQGHRGWTRPPLLRAQGILRCRRQVENRADTPDQAERPWFLRRERSEEHTSELQSLMRISYAVFCLKKKN